METYIIKIKRVAKLLKFKETLMQIMKIYQYLHLHIKLMCQMETYIIKIKHLAKLLKFKETLMQKMKIYQYLHLHMKLICRKLRYTHLKYMIYLFTNMQKQ